MFLHRPDCQVVTRVEPYCLARAEKSDNYIEKLTCTSIFLSWRIAGLCRIRKWPATSASGCPYRGLIMRADVSLFEQFVIISLIQILLAAALIEMMVYPAVAHELAVIVMVSSGGRCRGVRPDIRVVGSGRICHSGPSLPDGVFSPTTSLSPV